MDQSLDDIIAERGPKGAPRGRRNRQRDPGPRDGVRKSTRDDSRNIDRDWVHDKFENEGSRRGPARDIRDSYRGRPSPNDEEQYPFSSGKIRIDNLHYELNEDDLRDLFTRIGPVRQIEIVYDRAGRSDGRAFATYESARDAQEAIRQFNGANANGQPIRLTLMQGPSGRGRGGPASYDSSSGGGGTSSIPLADRISFAPRRRSRSPSSHSNSPRGSRRSDVSKPPPENIDRYIPGQRNGSPRGRRTESGRRPGARPERGGGGGGERGQRRKGGGGGERATNGSSARTARPRKTQEELDKEMDDYFGNNSGAKDSSGAAGASTTTAASAVENDIDMAE